MSIGPGRQKTSTAEESGSELRLYDPLFTKDWRNDRTANIVRLTPVKNAEQLISRILELTSTNAKWHRRLWRTGTVQLGKEFLEQVVDSGTSELAARTMSGHFRDSARSDPGARGFNSDIQKCLDEVSKGATRSSHSWLVLENLLELEENPSFEAEGCARRITAHLVDAGHHKMSIYPD